MKWESLQGHWKLSQRKLEEYYTDPWYVVGKRFNGHTSYLMLDIDRDSQYHPSHSAEQFSDLIGTCEDIGLVRPLLIRSSNSNGLHIFPLGEQLPTWKAAKRLQDHLTQHGFEMATGQLELFPNPKANGSRYHGHRLPLQHGSCLLSSDLEPFSDQPADFIRAWELAGTANDFELYQRSTAPRPIKKETQKPGTHINERPPIRWTAPGQSNTILRQLANWGYERLGLATVPELNTWMQATVPTLEGYNQFTSNDTKRDIEQSNWCERWAKSRIRRGGKIILSERADLNEARHQDAVKRLKEAVKNAGSQEFATLRAAREFLILKSKELFGIGFSIQTLEKLKPLWRHLKRENQQPAPPTVDQRQRCVPVDSVRVSRGTHPSKPPLNFLERCRKIADRINVTGQPSGFQGFEYPDSITSPHYASG